MEGTDEKKTKSRLSRPNGHLAYLAYFDTINSNPSLETNSSNSFLFEVEK